MVQIWLYAVLSVFLVGLISLSGAALLFIKEKNLKNILIHFVGFSTGAIFGDVFIHLFPQIAKETGFTFDISLNVLGGIILGFMTEKIICWRHCHVPVSEAHMHTFALMNIVGDVVHNFIDGMIIGASYLISISVGVATTMAVIFHEIPHELGNFGVLLHGGFTKQKALFYNFATAMVAILGVIAALVFSAGLHAAPIYLTAIAAGNFIYIAGSDLIPELHKDEGIKNGFFQLIFLLLGVFVMSILLLFEK